MLCLYLDSEGESLTGDSSSSLAQATETSITLCLGSDCHGTGPSRTEILSRCNGTDRDPSGTRTVPYSLPLVLCRRTDRKRECAGAIEIVERHPKAPEPGQLPFVASYLLVDSSKSNSLLLAEYLKKSLTDKALRAIVLITERGSLCP